MTLTPEQLDIVRHAVGNDGLPDKRPGYRNHYTVNPCGDNVVAVETLVVLGAMRLVGESRPMEMRTYRVTDEAMPLALAPLPGMREYVVEMTEEACKGFGWKASDTRHTYRTRSRSAAKYLAARSLEEHWEVPIGDALRMLRARLA